MEAVIFLTWLVLFLALPVALLITAGISYASGMEIFELLGRLSLAFIAHVFVTIFVSGFLLALIFGIEPRRGREWTGAEELMSVFTIFAYAVAGWLSCSFINGKLIKSWTHFSLDAGKPKSIFDAK